MTEDPNTVLPTSPGRQRGDGDASPSAASIRTGQRSPYLDGAWWPRSTKLPAELPALLAELSAQLGSIGLVGYHRDAWNAAPDHLDLAGHPVHLQGFVSPDPPTLVVIADTGRSINLRVVPPATDGASASKAMTAAAHHSVQPHPGDPVTAADAAETRSLHDLAARLARLPGNTDPEQAALISTGGVGEAADQVSATHRFRHSSRSSSSKSFADAYTTPGPIGTLAARTQRLSKDQSPHDGRWDAA